jgi:uroporphyrinogen decarboxylase
MLWIEPHATLKIANFIKPPQNIFTRLAMKSLSKISSCLPTKEMRNGAPLLASLFQQEYLLELGADIAELFWGEYRRLYKKSRLERGKIRIEDIYGIVRGMTGLYLVIVDVPCKTREDLDNYEFPDVSHPLFYNHIRQFRRKHPDIGIVVWAPGVQDDGAEFYGMERLYSGMIEYPEIIKRFFKKLTDHSIETIRGSLQAGADIIMIGDDYGTQENMFISKGMWTEFTYPCLKRQVEAIHEYGGKALLHSCGCVMPLLDKFVEAELDALHPLQPVKKNNLEEAKRLYGEKLTFFTGIDVQRIPSMKKEEVRESIVNAYKIASRGGGMVLSMTNHLQVDTPLQNLNEMFATIYDIREGRYD